MRSEYLDKFLTTLSPVVRDQLIKIYSTTEEPLSEEELERLICEFELDRTVISFIPVPQGGVISSSAHNTFVTSIKNDLNKLFIDSGRLDTALTDHGRLHRSALQSISSRLGRVEAEVEAVNSIGRDGYRAVWHDSLGVRASEPEQGPSFVLQNEMHVGKLILPVAARRPRSVGPSGRSAVAARVLLRHEGALFIPGHELEQAFDEFGEAFFAESAVVESPISGHTLKIGDYSCVYPGIAFGYSMEFAAPELVSELLLEPCSRYPMDLLGVCVLHPDGSQKWVHPIFGYEADSMWHAPIVVRFPQQLASSIWVYIGQRNYAEAVYRVERNAAYETWTRLDAPKAFDLDAVSESFDKSLVFWASQLSRHLGESEAAAIVKSVAELPEGTAAQVITAASNALEQYNVNLRGDAKRTVDYVTKTEYSYGIIRSIASDVAYMPEGEWISDAIDLTEDSYAFKLRTDITMPYVEVGGMTVPLAHAAWDINLASDNPASGWKAILPENESRVECEVLRVLGDGGATTRFKIDAVQSVYADGVRLSNNQYVWTSGSFNVKILNPMKDAIYSITYKPARRPAAFEDPYVVYVNKGSHIATLRQEFDCVPNTRCLVLSNMPFIDYGEANKEDYNPNAPSTRPIVVEMTGDLGAIGYPLPYGTVTMDSMSPIRNVTDYRTRSIHAMQMYRSFPENDPEAAVHFAHRGRRLIFAEEIPARITVQYGCAITALRVRLSLRKTVPGYDSLTPVVNNAILKGKIPAW